MKNLFIAVLIMFGVAGCSSESMEERLAAAKTPEEVVIAATYAKPHSVDKIGGTRYMAVIFRPSNRNFDSHLLDVKKAMPVLLDRYPEIDRFFFGWATQDGLQYMKVQMERENVAGVNWENLMVKDIEPLASMFMMPR